MAIALHYKYMAKTIGLEHVKRRRAKKTMNILFILTLTQKIQGRVKENLHQTMKTEVEDGTCMSYKIQIQIIPKTGSDASLVNACSVCLSY